MGTATGVRTTMSPLRSPPRLSTAACPGNIPPFGDEITVVKPAARQVSTRLSPKLAPETGTTVAPRMAKYCGSPPCASALAAPPKTAPTAAVTPSANLNLCNVERIHDSLDLDRTEGASQPPTSR